MTTVTVRLTSSMLHEIDRVLEEHKKKEPGLPFSRSDAIRELLFEALKTRR